MKFITAFMIVASAASLLACGKSEQVAAPATEPPVAEATQVEAAPVATIEPATPVVEPLPSEAVPAAPPVVTSAQPETKAAQPAAVQPVASPAAPAPVAAAPDLVHGQKIYRQACAFCHDRGVAGAPKTGDVAAWNARLAQGMASLYTVAIRGKGAMPARGGNPSLTDADVNAAVDYMIAQSR
ncbi:MAG: c-type cytochrome [Thiobacillus sp.]